MNYGIDFLGAARYQKTAISEAPRAFGFGVFAEVEGFGKAYDLIAKIAPLVPFIRVQLIWKDDHNFGAKELPLCKARIEKLLPIIKANPGTKWYISPTCEHRLNEKEWLKFADIVAKVAGGLVCIVNSPENGKGFVSREYINEYHHEKRPRAGGKFAFSFDGDNCVDSDIEAYKTAYQGSQYFMLWNSQCNGRRNTEDKTPRPSRQYWPIPKQIDSWVWLTRDRGVVVLPGKWLLKSHADQHSQPPAGKDQKPMFIIPDKVKEIVLKADNGQVIDTAKYFGTYTGGGYRYYFNQWGFELAQKAIRIHGKPQCNIFVNNKKVGVVNPAFRSGNYR
jgi:hypothetical protein